MIKLVRIPKGFYDDHTSSRDLPAPPIVSETKRHYVIDADHAEAAELLSDARFYAGPDGPCRDLNFDSGYLGLLSSARATVKALSA